MNSNTNNGAPRRRSVFSTSSSAKTIRSNIPPRTTGATGAFARTVANTGNRLSTDQRPYGYNRNSSIGSNMGIPASSNKRMGTVGRTLKDTRPISDKSYQSEMQKRVVAFLQDFSYSHPINENFRNQKDFALIVEFIYGLLDADYTIGKAPLEQEIPRLFRDLGYPVAIKANTMQPVGAPHTWGQLLAAITWLIDVIEMTVESNVECDGFSNEEINLDKYEFATSAYVIYQANRGYPSSEEMYGDCVEKLEQKLARNEEDDDGNTTELDRRVTIARDECNRLQIEASDLDETRQNSELDALNFDCRHLEDYLAKSDRYQEEMQNRLQDEKLSRGRLEQAIADQRKQIENLKHSIGQQKMTFDEFKSLVIQKNELRRCVQMLKSDQSSFDKDRWELETQIARQKTTIDTKYANFLLEAGKTVNYWIPGKDFRSIIKESTATVDPDFDSYLDTQIWPKIESLSNFVEVKLSELTKSMKDEELLMDQIVNEQCVAATEELMRKRTVLDDMKQELRNKKEEWDSVRHKCELDLDVIKNKYETMQKYKDVKSVPDLHEQIAHLEKERTNKHAALEKQFKVCVNQFTEAISTLATNIADYEERHMQVNAQLAARRKEMAENL